MVVLLDLSNERSYHKKNGIAHVDHLRRQRSDQNYSSFLHTQTPSAENFCQQGQDEQQQQPSLSHTSNESIAFNKAERGNNCACDNSEEHCYHELNGSASGGEIADDDEGNDNGRNDGNSVAKTTTSDPNMNTFSRALGCYPIIREIARQLDLNTIHDLSRTCRQVRANLLQNRRQLVRCSLRCTNDAAQDLEHVGMPERYQQPPQQRQGWQQASLDDPIREYALQQKRLSTCARDMVDGCRRCGAAVCRNCIYKLSRRPTYHMRFRRLCQVCQSVPLESHTESLQYALCPGRKTLANSSTDSQPAADIAAVNPISLVSLPDTKMSDCHPSSQQKYQPTKLKYDHNHQINLQHECMNDNVNDQIPAHSFTYDAFRRDPCRCEDSVWLCNDCGRTIHTGTVMYHRGWLWRKRYSDYLGGRNSGVGEGSEGVRCGREMYCLDAKEVEHVIEWNDRGEKGSDSTSPAAGTSAASAPGADTDAGIGQATSIIINGTNIGNGNETGIENNNDNSNSLNGPAVAGGDGGSGITISDYIEVNRNGLESNSTASTDLNNHISNHSQIHSHASSNSVHFVTGAMESAGLGANSNKTSGADTKVRNRHEPSYYAREVEGIGGVVRRTTSHRERVGAVVPEYEGERQTGHFLEAERLGELRSWCSWCFRVVPSKEDGEGMKGRCTRRS